MIEKGLTHHQVQHDVCLGAMAGGYGFSSHTFCEVFVGGRWRRLNYTTLGQNVLARNYLGLMIKVHTFKDLSEANLAATWGTRFAKGWHDEAFNTVTPIACSSVSDHFGRYANVPNPQVENEHKQVTIEKAYWPESKDAPKMVREQRSKAEPDGALFHPLPRVVRERGRLPAIQSLHDAPRKYSILRAEGLPKVPCHLSMNFFTLRSQNVCELEVVIPRRILHDGQGRGLHPPPGQHSEGLDVWKVVRRADHRNTPVGHGLEAVSKPLV